MSAYPYTSSEEFVSVAFPDSVVSEAFSDSFISSDGVSSVYCKSPELFASVDWSSEFVVSAKAIYF